MLKAHKISQLTSIGLTSLGLNTLYYMIQVRYFGVSREIENYFIAIGLCGLVLSFTIVGHISQIVVPIYLKEKQKNQHESADQIFSIVFNNLLLISILLTIFFYQISSFLVETILPGFSSSDHIETTRLFKVLVVTTPLQIINVIANSLLHANSKHGRAELVNVFRVFCSIIILILFFNNLGLYVLILSYWLEVLLNFILNLIFLYKLKFKYQVKFRSTIFSPITLFRQSTTIYLRNFCREMYLFCLTASISHLPDGVLALYKYTESIVSKIASTTMNPIKTIFFTDFAQSYNGSNIYETRQIKESLNLCFLYIIIALSFCISFGSDILGFLWTKEVLSSLDSLGYTFFVVHLFSLFFIAITDFSHKIALVINKVVYIYIAHALSWISSALIVYIILNIFSTMGLVISIVLTPILIALSSLLIVNSKSNKLISIFNTTYILKISLLTFFSVMIGLLIDRSINFFLLPSVNKLLLLLIKVTLHSVFILFVVIILKPFANFKAQ